MQPHRQWIAIAVITLILPIGASLAAPNAEGGGSGQGPREGGKGKMHGPQGGQRGDQKGAKHKPILEEVITFLKSQGISDISNLSEDRRAELSQAFRDAKGKEHMTARIRAMVDALVAAGITTPAEISAMSEEQRMAIMEAVREKMEADRPPMGGPGGGGPGGGKNGEQDRGPGGGPRGGGGPGGGEGPGGGGDRLLEHFANMLTEAGISDISNLTDSQIANLVPKPGDRKGGMGEGKGKGQGPGQGQGGPGGGQGKGPKGNREGKGPGKGPGQGQGPGGPGQGPGGPEGGGPRMDPVGQVLDFLADQGIDSIADLSAEQIEELQMTWHESMRPPERVD